MKQHLIQYLQYVKNTGGNATIANFDDDWAPIGPMLRSELMPVYVVECTDGKLALTAVGLAELAMAKERES